MPSRIPKVPGLLILSTLLPSCTRTHWASRVGLDEYKEAHYLSLPGEIRGPADWKDLDRLLPRIDLLALGDFHDDRSLHHRLLRLFERIENRKVVLLAEFFGEEDQEAADRFLSGGSSIEDFGRTVQERWPGSWMDSPQFDQDFYRSLALLARRKGFLLRALEPVPRLPLALRDRIMAKNIRKAHRSHPGSLLVLLVGHTHLLGSGHILDSIGITHRLVLLPRLSGELQIRLRRASREAWELWHPPFLELEEGLWFWNPLPYRRGFGP